MKRYIAIIISSLFIVMLQAGCIQSNKNNDKKIDVSQRRTTETTGVHNVQTPSVPYPLDLLKADDVELIKKTGGLPSDKNWLVLYPQKEDEKITKIIKILKGSDTRIEKASQQDMETLGYPVDIVIRMKDGNEFSIRWAMKLTAKKVSNRTETKGTLYDDRFILTYGKGKSVDSYVVYSENAPEYINKLSDSDFPRVPIYTIKPEEFKYSDLVSISGNGCTDDEVNILLTNSNDADNEEYVIGKVKPKYGEWQWEGVINKNIKTHNGKEIFLKNEKFFLGIQMGEHRYMSGQTIVFADYIYERDKIDGYWKESVVVGNCNIKNGPGTDYKNIGTIKYGDTVLLEGSYNGWFLAKSDGLDEFWIDGKNIAEYDNKNTFGVLTSDEVILGQISLYKGNLVWILKKDSERSYVRPVAIDVSGGYSGWIKNSDYTTRKSGVYFNQAFLKKDAKVYKEASIKSELFGEFNELSGGYIFIDKTQDDGWMYISAWGGINGWVKDTDIYLP